MMECAEAANLIGQEVAVHIDDRFHRGTLLSVNDLDEVEVKLNGGGVYRAACTDLAEVNDVEQPGFDGNDELDDSGYETDSNPLRAGQCLKDTLDHGLRDGQDATLEDLSDDEFEDTTEY